MWNNHDEGEHHKHEVEPDLQPGKRRVVCLPREVHILDGLVQVLKPHSNPVLCVIQVAKVGHDDFCTFPCTREGPRPVVNLVMDVRRGSILRHTIDLHCHGEAGLDGCFF